MPPKSDPKRSGNSGPYFNVLNSDSEVFRIWNNSESQFKTLKYRPDFPGRFDSIEAARVHCQAFFPWYNDEHRHTGLAIHTPADVHYGTAAITHQKRAGVLDAAYAATPQRASSASRQSHQVTHRNMGQPAQRHRGGCSLNSADRCLKQVDRFRCCVG